MTPSARNARKRHELTFGAAGVLVGIAAFTWAGDSADSSGTAPRWLLGDLHVHVGPPDEGHSTLTVETAVAAAKKAKLDFVAFTPHRSHDSFPAPEGGAAPAILGQELMSRALAAAGADPALLVIPGWEFTRSAPGHLGVTFANVRELLGVSDGDKARLALSKGALVTVNHPFFRPVTSELPLMKLVDEDLRWRPFFGDGKDDLAWNAIEVWHERSVLIQKMHANLKAKYPDTQMASDAMKAWDTATREQRRRIVAVGGSDCHGKLPHSVVPVVSMSALVEKPDLESLRRALLAAHVTFGRDGGPAARDFAATSDVDGERASIGDSLRAKSEVRLTWGGKAVLVENGERVGEFDGGAVRKLASTGAFTSWRIEKANDAYSNCIYANLP